MQTYLQGFSGGFFVKKKSLRWVDRPQATRTQLRKASGKAFARVAGPAINAHGSPTVSPHKK